MDAAMATKVDADYAPRSVRSQGEDNDFGICGDGGAAQGWPATVATLVSARIGRWNGDGSQASAAAIGWVGSGCPTSCPPAPTSTASTRVTRAVQGVRPNSPEGLTRTGANATAITSAKPVIAPQRRAASAKM